MEWLWFDVDTQRDFMASDGALFVPGAPAIVMNLNRLMRASASHGIPVASTMDAHTPNDPEFADWPPHCVVGTRGQEKIPETMRQDAVALEATDTQALLEALRAGRQILFPTSTIDCFENPRINEVLADAPERVAVYGVATDYCVRACALGCRKRGIRTFLVTDAIAGVAPETTDKALREMREAGVASVTTDELLEMLEER